jgi:AcrR family transcriptional regulator
MAAEPGGTAAEDATVPSARRLRRDAAHNRQRILAAARELFAERGLDVGVEQIAARAGVGMGTLYRRFPNKATLIDAIFEARLSEYLEIAERAAEREDAWEGLRTFLEAALGLQARDRGLKEILASRRHGRRGVDTGRRRVGVIMNELVARAQRQGDVRPDITAADVAMIMWGSGGVVDMTVDVAPNLWRRYLGLILDSLHTPKPSSLPVPPLAPAKLRAVVSTDLAGRGAEAQRSVSGGS